MKVNVGKNFSVLLIAILVLSFKSNNKFEKLSLQMLTRKTNAGKLFTMQGDIYFNASGKMVSHLKLPVELISVANNKGDVLVYNPKRNEVSKKFHYLYSTETSLMYYFLIDNKNELGLSTQGFIRQSSSYENDLLITKWLSPAHLMKHFSGAELVYQKGKPIFLKFTNPKGNPVKKVYFSNFTLVGYQPLPLTITQINYIEKDSSIERTEFTNLKLNEQADSKYFDFTVPANAKPIND
ncbi:MAG: hypothetical protein MUC81_06265 [Bacteroidia bacterium]|jgi:outer membrane lipoprotein-sorting protein|nr:hypothetical protein [Bacteroidia bacterium]